jgi:hypothetical protein
VEPALRHAGEVDGDVSAGLPVLLDRNNEMIIFLKYKVRLDRFKTIKIFYEPEQDSVLLIGTGS